MPQDTNEKTTVSAPFKRVVSKKFKAMAQGRVDYSVDVIPVESNGNFGTMMGICTEEGAVYITKQQAKEFFGFSC
jgi:hypothetical protein